MIMTQKITLCIAIAEHNEYCAMPLPIVLVILYWQPGAGSFDDQSSVQSSLTVVSVINRIKKKA